MLYTNTVKAEVFFLLERLMDEPLLKNFRLVGGTALALQKGHRYSDDLDLFTDQAFDLIQIQELLKDKFNDGTGLKISVFTYGLTAYYSFGPSDEVKIDIMNFHSDPFLHDYLLIDGIRLASIEEIAAMKLQAITSRKHKKDFIDLYVLLEEISLKEMIELFKRRFVFYDEKDALLAMGNVDEADSELMPYMFMEVQWEIIKQKIKTALSGYIKGAVS